MSNELGKRYTCHSCGTQLLVTQAGDGEVSCHGEPMVFDAPKQLPASD